jgi:hypothetical protein
MSLDATVTGIDANSYVTLQEADDYFDAHYLTAKTTAWATLSDAQKESALKRGCQIIDELRVLDTELGFGSLPLVLVPRNSYELTIHRLGFNQALNFPRNIDIDDTNTGIVPVNVKDAQCEQAIYFLSLDDAPMNSRMSGVGDETVSAGPVRIHQSFKDGGSSLAPMAWDLMRKYIRPTKRVQRA